MCNYSLPIVVTSTIVLASAARSPVDATPRRRHDASRSPSFSRVCSSFVLSSFFILSSLRFVLRYCKICVRGYTQEHALTHTDWRSSCGVASTIGSSQRDGGISSLPACLSLYRFFHFYSYRYIVMLWNVDCGGVIMCRHFITVLDIFFILLNKCEHRMYMKTFGWFFERSSISLFPLPHRSLLFILLSAYYVEDK